MRQEAWVFPRILRFLLRPQPPLALPRHPVGVKGKAARVVVVVAVTAGCSSTHTASGTTVTTTPPPASPSSTATTGNCAPAPGGNLIVWSQTPGTPPSAEQLGSTSLATCQPTVDYLRTASPTGAGYCTLVAPAAANPGYDTNTSPAPKPKDVVEAIGDC